MQNAHVEVKDDDRTVFIQANAAAVFSGGGVETFKCRNCGFVLAKDYNPRSLIAIDIQCFRCGVVSRTEQWPDGESLPAKLMRIDARGRYRISSTLVIDGGVALACDAEIHRVQLSTAAAPDQASDLTLSTEGLNLLQAELDILTEQEFSKMLAAAKRAEAAGNMMFTKCQPAWAVQRLRSWIDKASPDLEEKDVIAISYLQQLRHIIDRWRHHHFFPLVSRTFCSEFHHAVTMLSAAAYLSDNGNDIGITDTRSAVGRSPDLYINSRADRRASIEVKAPDLFSWPSPQLSEPEFEKHIHRVLRSAREQITGEDGGIVVIGTNCLGKQTDIFKAAIRNVIDSGKVSTRIAAVIGVSFTPTVDIHPGKMNFNVQGDVMGGPNPRYTGEIRCNFTKRDGR